MWYLRLESKFEEMTRSVLKLRVLVFEIVVGEAFKGLRLLEHVRDRLLDVQVVH